MSFVCPFKFANYTCELISESDIYIQCYRHFFVTALDVSFRDFVSLDPPPGFWCSSTTPLEAEISFRVSCKDGVAVANLHIKMYVIS